MRRVPSEGEVSVVALEHRRGKRKASPFTIHKNRKFSGSTKKHSRHDGTGCV